jgi:DNA-binding transcriptional regulator LsrR (DeoR family)
MRDNQIDAYSKGRREQPKSMHVNAKIPAAEVSRIRSRYKEGGITQKALASEYSVSQVSISLILRRKTYKDVE